MFKTLKPYWVLLHPYKKQLSIAITAGMVAGATTGTGIALGAENLFNVLMDTDVVLERHEMIGISLMFPAIFAGLGLALFINAYYVNYCAAKVVQGLRLNLFELIQNVQLSFFQKHQSGDLISRIMADCQMLQLILSQCSKNIITQPTTCVSALIALGVLANRNPGILPVLGSILIVPILIFPIRYFSSKIKRKVTQQQEEVGDLTGDVSQNISGAKEVRAFNLQNKELNQFKTKIELLFRAQMKVVKYSASLSPTVEFFTSFGLSIAFIVGKLNNVGAAEFIAVFLALYFFYSSIKKIGALSGELNKGIAVYSRIQETIDETIEINDPETAVPLGDAKGTVDFRNVEFSYADDPILKNISVSIKQGDICALVGPSGAGKSTFAHLIPRFYDVNSGSVLIDGLDVRNVSQHDLRNNIAVVSQDPVLFDVSITDNIRLGRLDATEEEVHEAAKLAFAHDFITEQDNGYDTIVGERGTRLSGGQKQRIAIARAFLRQAPILILDEATSALDSESETKIQKALEKLVIGKTVFIIAHRFSTIRIANRIIVFEKGHIIDEGPHNDLYERCPLYKSLADKQSA